jgi:ATP-dependent helicase HrpB
LLCEGTAATLSPASVVLEDELMVAVDAEERHGREAGVVVRVASRIEPEWLLALPGNLLDESDSLVWNEQSERVERWVRLSYGKLVLEETRSPAAPSNETDRVLAEAVLAKGLAHFVGAERLEAFRGRFALAAKAFPELGFRGVDEAALRSTLESACAGLRSFAEVREAGLLETILAQLSPEQARVFNTQLPERIALPSGHRHLTIHYEVDKDPWVESRLQDFFGMAKGPTVCGGRVPLVLHLLAPNGRDVQVTTDLAGFWDRHYPAIRKELSRKYPRHSWPEDPRTAAPPPPRGKR